MEQAWGHLQLLNKGPAVQPWQHICKRDFSDGGQYNLALQQDQGTHAVAEGQCRCKKFQHGEDPVPIQQQMHQSCLMLQLRCTPTHTTLVISLAHTPRPLTKVSTLLGGART